MPIHVRTPAGAEFYKQPIGSLVTRDVDVDVNPETGRRAEQTPSSSRWITRSPGSGSKSSGGGSERLSALPLRGSGMSFLPVSGCFLRLLEIGVVKSVTA